MDNITPKQIRLIGMLVVVLIGVVVFRMRPKSKQHPTGTAQLTASNEVVPSTQVDNTSSETVAEAAPLTPSVRLAELWKNNPFRGMTDTVQLKPEPTLDAPANESGRQESASERLLEELTGEPIGARSAERGEPRSRAAETGLRVSAILDDGRERRALVGNSIVSVGDELEGFEVVAIHSDRIELADPAPESLHSTKPE